MRICIIALAALSAAQAGQIQSLGLVTGGAAGLQTGLATPNINNDNVAGVSLNKFSFALNVFAISAIDHPLLTLATGGVTEYDVTVQITNNTVVSLLGWQFDLPGSPYDFDFPHFDSPATASNGWTVTAQTDKLLVFQGAALLPGGLVTLRLPIDVPDPGGSTFRSTPLTGTPEPASIALLAAPLALLALRKRSGLFSRRTSRRRSPALSSGRPAT